RRRWLASRPGAAKVKTNGRPDQTELHGGPPVVLGPHHWSPDASCQPISWQKSRPKLAVSSATNTPRLRFSHPGAPRRDVGFASEPKAGSFASEPKAESFGPGRARRRRASMVG